MTCGRCRTRPLHQRARGFTLIEAMLVVTLVAIIAAIAIPNYRDYIVRSNRSAARQVLVEAAQYLERNYTASGCYNFVDTLACLDQTGSATVQPSMLLRAPSEGRQTYVVTWAYSNSGTQYTLTATPCGVAGNCPSGAETGFLDPTCGSLILRHTGLREVSISGANVATCWQR